MGKGWPVAIVAFLSLVALLNVFFVVLAYRSSTGVIEERSYELGLNYEEEISKLRRGKELEWKPSLKFSDSDEAGYRFISFSLPKEMRGLEGAKIDIIRPSDSSLDVRELSLLRESNRYAGRAFLPDQGLWLFRLVITIDKMEYVWSDRVFLE